MGCGFGGRGGHLLPVSPGRRQARCGESHPGLYVRPFACWLNGNERCDAGGSFDVRSQALPAAASTSTAAPIEPLSGALGQVERAWYAWRYVMSIGVARVQMTSGIYIIYSERREGSGALARR